MVHLIILSRIHILYILLLTVKSPGTLVVSTYAPCPDITVKIEPALLEEGSALVYVPVSPGKYRFVKLYLYYAKTN